MTPLEIAAHRPVTHDPSTITLKEKDSGHGDEEEQALRYPCGHGTRIFIYLSPENAGKTPATLAGWFVHDLDQTMDELASRGVVFEQYDQPGIKTDERGVFNAGRFRAAWFKDPDGNTMALTEVSG